MVAPHPLRCNQGHLLGLAQRVEWEATPAGTLGKGNGQLETAEKGHTEELGFQPRNPASGAT